MTNDRFDLCVADGNWGAAYRSELPSAIGYWLLVMREALVADAENGVLHLVD
ncbi:MAG: hypothetical protein WAK31_29555 [Chthoniobacterales bacterium]